MTLGGLDRLRHSHDLVLRKRREATMSQSRTLRFAAAVLWLLVYAAGPVPLALFALIFAFEGFASLRQHWYNLPLATTAALFLVLWPLTALAGFALAILGRLRASVLVTAGTAVGLLVLWLASLALIVLVQ
jgi:hypothetical protein